MKIIVYLLRHSSNRAYPFLGGFKRRLKANLAKATKTIKLILYNFFVPLREAYFDLVISL